MISLLTSNFDALSSNVAKVSSQFLIACKNVRTLFEENKIKEVVVM